MSGILHVHCFKIFLSVMKNIFVTSQFAHVYIFYTLRFTKGCCILDYHDICVATRKCIKIYFFNIVMVK